MADSSLDWQVGEQIVVASSDFDPTHAEVRSIAAISGSLITLDRPLEYAHYSEVEAYGA